jgi:sensor histidine kinase YesM
MVGRRARGPWLRRWLISFATWTFVGLFWVARAVWSRRLYGADSSWSLIVPGIANMWLWALWTGSLFWWSRRFPLERGRWVVSALVHAALSAIYAAASTAFNFAFASLVLAPIESRFAAVYVDELFYNVTSYAAVIVIANAVAYARQLTERRTRAIELEHELTRTRLAALELQLRPHFLFNTLHSVTGLIRAGEPTAAIEMIGGLGDLLRTVLDRDGAPELALADELALAELYLGIERIRFADRLQVGFDIAPAARDALVPRLVLQPLLENAIRHGVQARIAGGEVTVRARCRDRTLELEVANPGADAGHGGSVGHGIGLQNTRDRLRCLYGAAHRLELSARPDGGSVVRLCLPLRRALPELA